MPNNFEVGDVVRCTEGADSLLTEGKLYTVVSLGMFFNTFLCVVGEGDSVSHSWWMPSRFVLEGRPKPKLTGMAQFYKTGR
jgi:hypothetical protein